MKKIAIYFLLAALIPLTLLGCAPLIIGGAVGAVGYYAVSKDTIQGETDKGYDSIWGTAISVAGSKGTIKQQDSSRGFIVLETESSMVWIRVIRLTRATVRLRISARKYHMPNLSLAQDIYTRIMDQAR